MKPGLLIIGIGALLLSATNVAAVEGRLGPNADASFSISLAIDPSMEITTTSDISISITDRTADASFSRSFCVTGTVGGKYTVIASGLTNPEKSRFLLTNPNSGTLQFDVSYRGRPESEVLDPLPPDIPSPAYDVTARDQGCRDTTYFNVTFRREDLATASSGLYNGSLTLLIAPM